MKGSHTTKRLTNSAGARTASELREVFGSNLRLLTQDAKSIAAVCRDLSINRTQFNRYLAGETYPRPDVLDRICRYFKLDARILLEPLKMDETGALFLSQPYEIIPPPLLKIDHARLPDGLYRIAWPSTVETALIYLTLVLVGRNDAGTKTVTFALPKKYGADLKLIWAERKCTAAVRQHLAGFSMFWVHPRSYVSALQYYSYGFQNMPYSNSGYVALTQGVNNGMMPVQPIIMERVEPGFRNGMAARRRCGYVTHDEVPAEWTEYFRTWTREVLESRQRKTE